MFVGTGLDFRLYCCGDRARPTGFEPATPWEGSDPILGRCRMSPKTLGLPYVYREPGGSLPLIVRGQVELVTVVFDGFLMGK